MFVTFDLIYLQIIKIFNKRIGLCVISYFGWGLRPQIFDRKVSKCSLKDEGIQQAEKF